MARSFNEIKGMFALEVAVRRIGEVPKKVVTKAARAGAKIAYKSAKANAPHKTFALRNGIIMRVEKQKTVGKRVFDIKMAPKMDDIFVDISRAGKRAYYPASQEYGFLDRNGRKVPGKRYLKRAIDANKQAMENAVIEVALKEIDKAWNAR
jgi:hypothetical protein